MKPVPTPMKTWFRCLLAALVLAVACREDIPDDGPPPDTPPVIRRLAPRDPSLLVRPGQQVTFSCFVGDGQLLARWQVAALRLQNYRYHDTTRNGRDTVVATADTLGRQTLFEQGLAGTSREVSYTYTVPEWPVFTRIELWARVEDRGGPVSYTHLRAHET
jgi:hypothetical protein